MVQNVCKPSHHTLLKSVFDITRLCVNYKMCAHSAEEMYLSRLVGLALSD